MSAIKWTAQDGIEAHTADAGAGSLRHGDAVICDHALDAPFLDRTVRIAFGTSAKDMSWRNSTGTLRELLESLCTFERGAKDGRCLLQGAVVEAGADKRGVQRLKANMAANAIMMFDYDKGESLEDVADKIQAAGLFALLWTTHSHLKTETVIPEKKLEAYMREIGRCGIPPTDAEVIDYLRQKAKILDEFLTNATVKGRVLREGGVKYIVSHPPIPRLRALFALKEPYDFANHAGMSQAQAMAEWSRLYAAVSDSLGLPYDRTCGDPSRLMYIPRIADEAVIGEGASEIAVLAGAPLDLRAFEQAAAAYPGGKSRPQPDASPLTGAAAAFARGAAQLAARGRDGAPASGGGYVASARPWLKKFAGICGEHFRITDWLQEVAPEDVRGKAKGSGGKLEWKCPNDVATDSMLRVSDLAALRVREFRSPNGQWVDTFTVQVKKTGEEVDCPVQEHTRKSLARYVETYRLNDDSFLFPVSRKTLERHVKRWARALGHDPRKYACHSLRRSKAVIMAHECSAAELDMIRISLGHAWLSSTQKYLGTNRKKALAFSRSFIV